MPFLPQRRSKKGKRVRPHGDGKAGQGGTELAVLDMVGGITGLSLLVEVGEGSGLAGSYSRQPDTTPLASLSGLLRAGSAGSEALSVLSIFLSAAVGEQMPGEEHKGHYLQLFPIQPKTWAHSRGTQNPEGTQSPLRKLGTA